MIDREDKPTLEYAPPTAAYSAPSLEAALQDQEARWQRGEPIRVEDLLNSFAGLGDAPEAVLELIYNEAILREERGETPSLAEFQQRFPSLADVLRIQWEVDRALLSRRSKRSGNSRPNVAAVANSSTGKRVGRYEILSVLGRGGMGIAYQAWDPQLKRVVALKMIKSGDDVSDDELARFRTEAAAIAQVKHPHIVQIFDVGEHEGQGAVPARPVISWK